MNLLTLTLQKYVDRKNDLGIVSQDQNEGVLLVKAILVQPLYYVHSKFLRQEVCLKRQSGAEFEGVFA
jgi:hypothetical protein